MDKMNITIENSKKLESLRDEFTQFFPFLTLEFFESLNSTKTIILNGHVIGEYRKNPEAETLSIFPEMSVADLEKILRDHFRLPVHVLRKSGNVWLKTSHTEAWSLQQQNRQGEIVSAHLDRQNETKNK
jgi:hypothetical protein